MQDKRLVDRLTQQWEKLRGEDAYPSFKKLNKDVIADLWEKCVVLEVENAKATVNRLYTYQHMGTDIIKAYGSDLSGNYVNMHMHNFPGWQVLKSVDKVFTEPRVFNNAGSFVNDVDEVIKYRACIMPYGTPETITHALVGLSWKVFK